MPLQNIITFFLITVSESIICNELIYVYIYL